MLRQPWCELKKRHFGGADQPLHASELRYPTPEQVTAVGEYFRHQEFGRFAVTMPGIFPDYVAAACAIAGWQALTRNVALDQSNFSTQPDLSVMPFYSFSMCHVEGQMTFICSEEKTLGEAMSRAVDLAFEYGSKRNVDSLRSCFICVSNEQMVRFSGHLWRAINVK